MKRLLYFTGYRMVAQEWDGRRLNSSVYFEPDEQGLDLFEAYLTSLKNEPIKLMVDLIEEEFRQATIPLLKGADRQSVIDRNFAKFFRNSNYRHAARQAVHKKDRKEEKLLISGLTNQNLLKPWLEIIDKTKTPLSGILSLPLVSEDAVSDFKSENDCVILVSQQVPSNLRQSVFIKGKLVLSRLVPLASFYQGDYANDVMRDIESTQRYLTSQRLIDRTDIITVHILCNKRHYEKLTGQIQEDTYFDYQIHEINEVIKEAKIEVNEEQDFSSVYYCYYAVKKSFSNHYARPIEKKYFYHHLTGLGLKVSSIVMASIALGVFSVSIVKATLYEFSISEMQLLEQKYTSKYNQLNERKKDSNISTTNMRNVVLAVQAIQQKYLYSPKSMMSAVSEDITLFPDVRVTELEWFISNSPTSTQASGQSSSQGSNRRDRRQRGRSAGNSLYEIVTVNADLLNFDGDYRYALSVVDDLEASMNISGKYFQVNVLKKPLNIQPDQSIRGDVSQRVNFQSGNNRASFTLRVVREVPLNAK